MLDRLRSAAPTLVALLCLIVLTVRLSGVHAHRDLAAGLESMPHEHGHHEHGHHHDDHAESSHAAHADGQFDVKVDAVTGRFDPLGKLGSVLVAILLLVTFSLLAPRRSIPRPPSRAEDRSSPRIYWRPPLRGPPQVSIARASSGA